MIFNMIFLSNMILIVNYNSTQDQSFQKLKFLDEGGANLLFVNKNS